VARTGSGHILGDETDSVGTLSGGLATETDSVDIPASGGIATETDIMRRPVPGRSLYTEYTVYRHTYLDTPQAHFPSERACKSAENYKFVATPDFFYFYAVCMHHNAQSLPSINSNPPPPAAMSASRCGLVVVVSIQRWGGGGGENDSEFPRSVLGQQFLPILLQRLVWLSRGPAWRCVVLCRTNQKKIGIRTKRVTWGTIADIYISVYMHPHIADSGRNRANTKRKENNRKKRTSECARDHEHRDDDGDADAGTDAACEQPQRGLAAVFGVSCRFEGGRRGPAIGVAVRGRGGDGGARGWEVNEGPVVHGRGPLSGDAVVGGGCVDGGPADGGRVDGGRTGDGGMGDGGMGDGRVGDRREGDGCEGDRRAGDGRVGERRAGDGHARERRAGGGRAGGGRAGYGRAGDRRADDDGG